MAARLMPKALASSGMQIGFSYLPKAWLCNFRNTVCTLAEYVSLHLNMLR